MPLIFGCIAPHGSQCIAELTANPAEGLATRNAMADLGRRLGALAPGGGDRRCQHRR